MKLMKWIHTYKKERKPVMASIKKRITSKGEAHVITYYDLSGRRRSKTIYGTRWDAEAWAKNLEDRKQLRRLKNNGNKHSLHTERVMFSVAKEEYLASVSITKAERTIEVEKRVFKAFLESRGDILLSSINLKLMEGYVADRLNFYGISPVTIGIEIRTLKSFFNHLIKYELMEKNPTSGLKLPKVDKKKIRFLTQDEIERLLKAVDNPDYRDLFVVYLNTGARRIELLSKMFTWADVDFKGRRLRLTGKGSSRYVPMNDVVHDILTRRKKSGIGTPFPMDYHYLYKKFRQYVKKAKIENVTLHDLRKTFGSLLISKGVDIYRVSKLLGHSSVTVTESHYVDILDRDLEETVKKLDSIF
jgi:integrase